jgi:pimeloyl-ACP methyl ester carboxylesterase
LTFALLGLPFLLGFLLMVGLVYSPCADRGMTPSDYGHAWEEITLPARAGGTFRGYFIPGTNGAAIIVVPALNAGRDGRLREAMLLARHGYAILAYESRRCAEMGGVSLGYKEVDEVADALDYLLTRPEVDPERSGVYGFSSAGATAIMAAARLPQLKAVAAEGGYGDFAEDTLTPGAGRHGLSGYFEAAFFWSIGKAYGLLTGLDINLLSPVDVISQIAPRPILLIYGSQEVSLEGGRRQQAAAGDNAELWIVEGAGHGNYFDVAPEAYETKLVTFFDESLNKGN